MLKFFRPRKASDRAVVRRFVLFGLAFELFHWYTTPATFETGRYRSGGWYVMLPLARYLDLTIRTDN